MIISQLRQRLINSLFLVAVNFGGLSHLLIFHLSVAATGVNLNVNIHTHIIGKIKVVNQQIRLHVFAKFS